MFKTQKLGSYKPYGPKSYECWICFHSNILLYFICPWLLIVQFIFRKGVDSMLKMLSTCVIITFVWQMTTAISIEDVRREVKILKALSGHKHLVKFHDACEDANNVYIVMEYVFSCFMFHCLLQNKSSISEALSLFLFWVPPCISFGPVCLVS